ncbi:GLPGLI family protein [Winogradskyella vidalii]|uniref:GLPGLI family protein n=1 Tax=Winogradskyella vidalii TaxID=2615024 RepID=UPI0015C75558|nr:GLPGLI family protein [Winogradskyella vidalii]
MNSKSIFIFSTLILLLFSSFCLSQNSGKAFYKKQSKHNFSNIKELDNNTKAKSAFKSVNNTIDEMEFELMFNDSLASYRKLKKLNSDSQSSSMNLATAFSGYSGPYYFNLKTRQSLREQGKYIIEKDFEDYDWTLTKEKMMIDSLTCYKATTILKQQGRRGEILKPVIAWYTTDINLQVGPDGFSGLPGLIIQLEVDKVITTLQKIKFLEKKIDIDIPTKGKKMTEQEYAILMKDLVENREKYYGKN